MNDLKSLFFMSLDITKIKKEHPYHSQRFGASCAEALRWVIPPDCSWWIENIVNFMNKYISCDGGESFCTMQWKRLQNKSIISYLWVLISVEWRRRWRALCLGCEWKSIVRSAPLNRGLLSFLTSLHPLSRKPECPNVKKKKKKSLLYIKRCFTCQTADDW